MKAWRTQALGHVLNHWWFVVIWCDINILMYFAGKDSFQNMQIQLTIKSDTGHYPCLHSFNLITINQHVTPLPLQQTRLERFPTNEAETRCDASPWQTTTSCEACTRWSHHARIERSTEQIKLILSPKKITHTDTKKNRNWYRNVWYQPGYPSHRKYKSRWQ